MKNDKTLKPSTKKFSFNRNTLLGTFKEPIDLREHKFNFSVSPNPFKNELSIKVNADKDETSRIILFSITGQQVFEKEFKINKGNNSLTVNPEISNGVYLLHYISNNETIIKKIIKD
ncbi:T9SS type A sorting domain-containing protein [uncultured Polaribacter sp.]|uniref:T9SS type A sorting domain-containing protein n=1 Tax=uncultured Polaribacter sp. TaxID=174711 RepID=UPI00263729C7|nr:T9SS type A sorting domain-containing protein [uncultured Polaribacter sp.]